MADEEANIERAEARSQLAAWTSSFESRFSKVSPQIENGPIAPTREPYVEIAGGIPFAEPAERKCYCLTPAAAIAAWAFNMERYADDRSGSILYWRIMPEIDYFEHYLRNELGIGPEIIRIWKVYARLLISDKGPKNG